MPIGDKIKTFLDKHGDKIEAAIDKAGKAADRKTGGKYSSKIDAAQRQVRKAVDKVGAQSRPGDRPSAGGPGGEPPA